MSNIFLNAFMVLICVGFIGFDLVEVKKFKDKVNAHGKNIKFVERDPNEKLFYRVCGIVCIITIGAIIVLTGFKYFDIVILFGMILAIIVTAYTNENQSSALYYTRQGFFLNDGFVNYKQVKNVLVLSSRKGKVIFNDGKEVRVSGKKALMIEKYRKVK